MPVLCRHVASPARAAVQVALALLVLLMACRDAGLVSRALDAGRLGQVRVIMQRGARGGLVYLFTSERGWDAGAEHAARSIAGLGVVVVGVDLPSYLDGLARSDDGCHYLISEIEELSKRIQREEHFAEYRTPILAGFGAGGMLAYAALAQSPAATIAGAAAVDPTDSVRTKVPLCEGAKAAHAPDGGFRYAPDATLPGWWRVDRAAGTSPPGEWLVALLKTSPAETSGAATDHTVQSLPLVEYPVEHKRASLFAVIYSGDGGWRDLDKEIGEVLAREGVPVVGVDSLRYFWHRKPPATMGEDLAKVVRSYAERWGTSQVVLVGYSFGADILPFAVNRLPADVSQRVRQVSLLGVEPMAAFEFSVAGWFGAASSEEVAVLPELLRMDLRLVQCFYGEDEPDTLCRSPALSAVETIRTSGGHHFGGDYPALARRILDGLDRRATAAGDQHSPAALTSSPRP
jgi:type IV secretory pathway VirJ component